MDHQTFNHIFERQVESCREVLVKKAAEYATEDRLHNFKVAAALQGVTERRALGGMMVKHIVSLYDMINAEELAPDEVWDEKLGDALNYLFLLRAVIDDERLEI